MLCWPRRLGTFRMGAGPKDADGTFLTGTASGGTRKYKSCTLCVFERGEGCGRKLGSPGPTIFGCDMVALSTFAAAARRLDCSAAGAAEFGLRSFLGMSVREENCSRGSWSRKGLGAPCYCP